MSLCQSSQRQNLLTRLAAQPPARPPAAGHNKCILQERLRGLIKHVYCMYLAHQAFSAPVLYAMHSHAQSTLLYFCTSTALLLHLFYLSMSLHTGEEQLLGSVVANGEEPIFILAQAGRVLSSSVRSWKKGPDEEEPE